MSQLKALKQLYVGSNKLPSTEVDFIIESFPQLTDLGIDDLGLTGEHLCSTNCALKLVFAELPSTIGNLKSLVTLGLEGNALTGELSRSTNPASDPSRTRACSVARVFRPADRNDLLQPRAQCAHRSAFA